MTRLAGLSCARIGVTRHQCRQLQIKALFSIKHPVIDGPDLLNKPISDSGGDADNASGEQMVHGQ